MPSRLTAPVLTLDAAKMHKIDPRNVESLFGMWTVFNKCSQSIKDGSRLENMSWRVWARETLCCPPQPDRTIVPAIDIPLGRASEVPSLSNSFASQDSNTDEESSSRDRNLKLSPGDDDDGALSKSRGKETHLTAFTLEKIVTTIQEKAELGPLSPSIQASLPPMRKEVQEIPIKQLSQEEEDHSTRQLQNSTDSCLSGTTAITTSTSRQSDHRNSDTSVSSDGLIRTGSIVHGFSPISTSFHARPANGFPVPATSKLAPKPTKKAGMFQLGVSSEDEDNSSFESRMPSYRPNQRSSLSQSLSNKNLQPAGLQKKVTSFRDVVEQRRIKEAAENDEGAIASSDEEDDESAIDDDEEEGDWEDSNSDEERAPAQEQHLFRRVDSRANLTSRPSMLSMQLQDKQNKPSGLSNVASRSSPAFQRSRTTSPNGPSMPESPEENEDEGGLMMQTSKTQPRPIIMTTTNSQHGMAHSPRTTRRNMLSTELTESLRKNLLWERQQKSQTANAFLKRTRNAQSMANLQAAGAASSQMVPTATPTGPPGNETSKNNSWNYYNDNPWEYNTKGW